jgi:hypothetical protein
MVVFKFLRGQIFNKALYSNIRLEHEKCSEMRVWIVKFG